MTPNPESIDRLIDVLLEDELGRSEPVDLTQRVLARAFPSVVAQPVVFSARPRRTILAWSAVAAAAAIALVVGVIALRARYPDPVVEGTGALARGTVLKTESKPATLKLGGYSAVQVAPESSIRVEGAPRAERVALLAGEVRCAVDKNVGSFDVWTPAGLVSVRGTEFTVRVEPRVPAASKPADYTLAVTVLSGRVSVQHNGTETLLDPGPERVFSTVVSKDPPPQRLPLEIDGQHNALARGVVEGTVKGRTDRSLELTSLSGKTEQYHPEWEGRENGGPNRAIVAQITKLHLGARIRIHWYVDNKIRIQSIEVLDNNPGEKQGDF